MTAKALVAHGLLVNLGDQRACGVEIKQVARLRIFRHGFRHPMGGKHHRLFAMFGRDFMQFLNENRTLGFQPFHHITVMHDFVADIDRRTIGLQRQHDDLDRPVHARAKAARSAQPYRQRGFGNGDVHSCSLACFLACSMPCPIACPLPGGARVIRRAPCGSGNRQNQRR